MSHKFCFLCKKNHFHIANILPVILKLVVTPLTFFTWFGSWLSGYSRSPCLDRKKTQKHPFTTINIINNSFFHFLSVFFLFSILLISVFLTLVWTEKWQICKACKGPLTYFMTVFVRIFCPKLSEFFVRNSPNLSEILIFLSEN